jgi:hypothetical protein
MSRVICWAYLAFPIPAGGHSRLGILPLNIVSENFYLSFCVESDTFNVCLEIQYGFITPWWPVQRFLVAVPIFLPPES